MVLPCWTCLTERVPKRIDFAKERRAQGRSLDNAVRKLVPIIQPLAQQHGIDLQARLNEDSARKSEQRRLLAERLQESVVPLFIGGSDGTGVNYSITSACSTSARALSSPARASR